MPIARTSPFRHRSPTLPLLATVYLILLMGCSTTPPEASDGPPDPEFVVSIKDPAQEVVGGTVTVTGTIAITNPPKGKTLVATLALPNGKTMNCPVKATGKTFTFECKDALVTLDGDGKPLFKENASIALTVTVTYKNTDFTGSASKSVRVDNLGPVIVIDSPAPGGVYIGVVKIKGHIDDKSLKASALSLGLKDAETLDPLELKDAKTGQPLQVFKTFELDWKPPLEDQASHAYTLNVHADDAVGHPTDAQVTFSILRAPSIMGDTLSTEGAVYDAMTDDVALDFVLGDLDQDGVLDAVVAGKKGIIVRRGLANPETNLGTGHFDLPPLNDPGSKDGKLIRPDWRFQRINGFDARKLELIDLDGDGDLDVLAVGVNSLGEALAWALLNFSVTPLEDGTPGRIRLMLVDSMLLPAEPSSLALVDLNPDEDGTATMRDLVVGAKAANKGLTTVLLGTTDALCDCGKIGKFACADPQALKCMTEAKTAVTATIFPKSKTAVHTIIDKGVTGITSIAIGDFYADSRTLPDLCVGEEARPRVSCYRNHNGDGSLEAAQDSYAIQDAGANDAHFVMALEWTSLPPGKPDGPDLIVSTHQGFMRWLRGTHNGTFTYTPASDKRIVGTDIYAAAVVANGPSGTPYLYVNDWADGQPTREVRQIPLLSGDNSVSTNCFRSWILADGVRKLLTADLDGDQRQDLVALDFSSQGLQVAFGSPVDAQDFVAPPAYHVCSYVGAVTSPIYAMNEVAQVVVADFTKDQKPELMMIGKSSYSFQKDLSGRCTSDTGVLTFKPVWTFSLAMNQQGRWLPSGRIGEFAPYSYQIAPGDTAKQSVLSGASSNCPEAPKPIGSVVGAEAADMNNDGLLDLVTVRSVAANYALGGATAAGACGCLFAEKNEINPGFGIESPEKAAAGAPGCCRIYDTAKDPEKQSPLIGYGGGAPLDRGSLHVWLNKDANKPFGLDGNAVQVQSPVTQPPPVVKPDTAVAGGLDPKGLAVADLDGNKTLDVVTLMGESGSRADPKQVYLDNRLRVFKGDGKGKLAVHDQADVVTVLDAVTLDPFKVLNVSYLVVDAGPISVFAVPFCNKDAPTILTLNTKQNTVSMLRNLGNAKFATGLNGFPVEDGVSSMSVRDVDAKDCVDVLLALKSSIGFLRGVNEWFDMKINLVESQENSYVGTELLDVNKDGWQDLALLNSKQSVVELYLGDGNGGFVKYPGTLLTPGGVKRVQQLDIDADGCADLVVHSTFGATLLRNTLPPEVCAKPN